MVLMLIVAAWLASPERSAFDLGCAVNRSGCVECGVTHSQQTNPQITALFAVPLTSSLIPPSQGVNLMGLGGAFQIPDSAAILAPSM